MSQTNKKGTGSIIFFVNHLYAWSDLLSTWMVQENTLVSRQKENPSAAGNIGDLVSGTSCLNQY